MPQKLFSKNFTLLVFGQVSSLFGNIILRFALSMYVLEQTGSAAVFAGILAVATIPTVLLSPFGGILADRANRRNVMVALDALSGVSVLLGALLFDRGNSIAVISALLVVLSVLGAFETPTVQACVPQMQAGDNIIRGNAVVSQIAAVSTLVAPILGSILYTAFGVKPVMLTSIACFFLTATFECFIHLKHIPFDSSQGIGAMIKSDFLVSMKFLCKEEPSILKLLLLAAVTRFFVIGTAMVGLPYMVRNILLLSATYYGAAEGALAVSTMLGSIAAGLLITKLKIRKLSLLLGAFGLFLLPAGVAFLLPIGVGATYVINVLSFCGIYMAITVYSIFAVSVVQQKTPTHLTGKIMAYTATITMCVQPLGQIAYGFLFDRFSGAVYLVLIPTGLIVLLIGLLATGFFRRLEKEQTAEKPVTR